MILFSSDSSIRLSESNNSPGDGKNESRSSVFTKANDLLGNPLFQTQAKVVPISWLGTAILATHAPPMFLPLQATVLKIKCKSLVMKQAADWMILKRHAKCVCVHGTSVLTIINLGVFYL